MIFRRTSSSFASLHHFYRTDVIVFCEGGNSLTPLEAMLPSADGRTLDTIFWSTLVNTMGFRGRYHFKSVGNKDTLLAIALDAEAANAKSITVCFDRDYDFLLGKHRTSPRVAYTYGYSWENDVVSPNVLQGVLSTLIGPLPSEINEALSASHDELRLALVKWCEIDVSLQARSEPSVFDREKPLSCADLNQRPPRIKHSALKARMKTTCGYTRRPKRIINVTPEHSTSVVFGKFLSRLMYHRIIFFANQVFPVARIDYDIFMRLAIAHTFTLLSAGQLPALSAYYIDQKTAFEVGETHL